MSPDSRPSGQDIAAPLLAILRDRLATPDLEYAEAPETLADGVTARAYAFRLALEPGSVGAGALVCRVFVGGFGLGDQTLVEDAIHNALADHGFGVPRVLASGDETSPLQTPFMVMERAEGQNAFGPLLLALGLGVLALLFGYWLPLLLVLLGYWTLMVRILTRLHAVPGEAVIAALEHRRLAPERLSVSSRIREFQGLVEAEEFAPLRPLVAWLAENEPKPAAAPVVCHGDFWFGNVMISSRRRSVTLLDWTQACIGHPEVDLGWMANQHYSRFPIRTRNEAMYAFATELSRPFAFMLLGANITAYRLLRGVDRGRLQYFTVFSATRSLVEVTAARIAFEASGSSVPPAILLAWGSKRSVALLAKKVRALTGLQLEL